MSHTQELVVDTRAVTLPRVNLLPPEITEARAFRRVQLGLAAAVLSSVGVVALLYAVTAGQLPAARHDLASATAERTGLATATTSYAGVTATYSRAGAEQSMLTTAMGDEVRYSQLLDDLTRSVPAGVWLKTLSFTRITAPSTPGTPATATPGRPPAPAGVASMTATGIAFRHEDVAAWLQSLAGQKTYSATTLASSSEVLLGTRPTVNFSTSATVTGAASSGRYSAPAGG